MQKQAAIQSWGSNRFGQAPSDVALSEEATSAAGGDTFSAAVDAAGRVHVWGTGFCGELGTGERDTIVSTPTVPTYFKSRNIKIISVACGQNHVLAAISGGGCLSWGSNTHTQLGHGVVPAKHVCKPAHVIGLGELQLAKVAAGATHSLALTQAGTVWSWGSGSYGQLGLGAQESAHIATKLDTLASHRILSIAAGWGHSTVASTNGVLLSFGWGLYSQLGHGSTDNEHTPRIVEALNGIPGGGIAAVACGDWHTAAVSVIGDVYTWGWGKQGQLGHRGPHNACPGVMYGPGDDGSEAHPRYLQLPPALDANDDEMVVQVACGARFTAALTASNKLIVWGETQAVGKHSGDEEEEARKMVRSGQTAESSGHPSEEEEEEEQQKEEEQEMEEEQEKEEEQEMEEEQGKQEEQEMEEEQEKEEEQEMEEEQGKQEERAERAEEHPCAAKRGQEVHSVCIGSADGSAPKKRKLGQVSRARAIRTPPVLVTAGVSCIGCGARHIVAGMQKPR
jgi:alpha-tubulin suppressor-like RCC1 family protein